MDRAEQLQFQSLPPAAQYEALWRLALGGLTVEQVAERTGWSPERICQTINPEPAVAVAPWRTLRVTRRNGQYAGDRPAGAAAPRAGGSPFHAGETG